MALTTLNTAPIFTGTPRVGFTTITSAQNNSQGSGTVGTNIYLAFSAGASGSYLQKVRFTLGGASANTASTAGVLRVYISSVNTGTTTQTNTYLYQEVTAAAQTPNVITTLTGATYPIDVPLNFAIPSGQNVLVGASAVTSANTVWNAIVFGGDY
jgi:hypothetical protein